MRSCAHKTIVLESPNGNPTVGGRCQTCGDPLENRVFRSSFEGAIIQGKRRVKHAASVARGNAASTEFQRDRAERPYLLQAEAVEKIGVSRPTFAKWIRLGKVEAHRVGREVRIMKVEIARLRQERRVTEVLE